jgi:hypothetical protein
MKLMRCEERWAEAAMGAIFPGSRRYGLADIRAMDVPAFLRGLLGAVPAHAALGMRVAIWLVALAPLVVLGRFATIAGLALPEREAVLARLVASRTYAVRQLAMVLKATGALLYAGDDRVRARMQKPRRAQAARAPLVRWRTKRAHPVA